ncbi:hypothetical protein PPSQR21_038440 [Paenibacillus polymyxa SQR-21]|nr:hypothetical protein PPSQR21_038440 [Paenibacillus polymyxa SQR-21]
MRNFVDSIFGPILGWLNGIAVSLSDLSVPLSRPLNFSKYFGYFSFLGSTWMTFITTCCTLAFIYLIVYIIKTQWGLILHVKDLIKWW